MRTKILLLTSFALATTALVATPLTAAQAAGTYKVSAGVSDSTLDLTSGDGKNRSTKIKGKVTGGPVKGQRVYMYAENLSTESAAHKYIGSATLSSSGTFSKTWKPKDGGSYLIDVVKKASGSTAEGHDHTRVKVYQFVSLKYFFDADASSGATYESRERFGNGVYYLDEYAVTGGGRAVFDTRGYYCMRVNFKTGLSTRSSATASRGTFRVKQSKTLVSKEMKKGQVYEASKTVQKKMNASDEITFSVDARPDLDDQTKLRFVFGRPVVACTYPTDSTPYR